MTRMFRPGWLLREFAVLAMCGAIALPAETFTTLYSFCSKSGCTDGSTPFSGLIQATNGDLYGTTSGGGANGNYGTVFKITPGGALTTFYSFCTESGCTDGEDPGAALVQANNGNFYGTTASGGAYGSGTVFKITPSGTLTTLYSFCSKSGCTDGSNPSSALIQYANGDLYGTTSEGGANGNRGTVFKITLGGELTTLYSFCPKGDCADGFYPSGLVQAINRDMYGTTQSGGAAADGTVFRSLRPVP
jgi:uncharacterized repeat protein (TIGR03803 family)